MHHGPSPPPPPPWDHVNLLYAVIYVSPPCQGLPLPRFSTNLLRSTLPHVGDRSVGPTSAVLDRCSRPLALLLCVQVNQLTLNQTKKLNSIDMFSYSKCVTFQISMSLSHIFNEFTHFHTEHMPCCVTLWSKNILFV